MQVETLNSPPILLVEDERDHALLIQDALQSARTSRPVQVVESGEQAIAYLSGEGVFADRTAYPFPSLVLLDLRMPGIGGFGVLRWLRAHPNLSQQLNVVVLSALQSPKEIDVAYELGARLYWAKKDCVALQERVRLLMASFPGLN